MKKKIEDIDIDFIGGQGPLTIEEEKALNDFFRKQKNKAENSGLSRKRYESKKVKTTI